MVKDRVHKHGLQQQRQGTSLGHPPAHREGISHRDTHPAAAAATYMRSTIANTLSVQEEAMRHVFVCLIHVEEADIRQLLPGAELLGHLDHLVELVNWSPTQAECVPLIVPMGDTKDGSMTPDCGAAGLEEPPWLHDSI